jgi:hypothetical protein
LPWCSNTTAGMWALARTSRRPRPHFMPQTAASALPNTPSMPPIAAALDNDHIILLFVAAEVVPTKSCVFDAGKLGGNHCGALNLSSVPTSQSLHFFSLLRFSPMHFRGVSHQCRSPQYVPACSRAMNVLQSNTLSPDARSTAGRAGSITAWVVTQDG